MVSSQNIKATRSYKLCSVPSFISSLFTLSVDNNSNTCLQDEKALYDAAERGDVSTVRRLIGSNVNINCTPLSGMTHSYITTHDNNHDDELTNSIYYTEISL